MPDKQYTRGARENSNNSRTQLIWSNQGILSAFNFRTPQCRNFHREVHIVAAEVIPRKQRTNQYKRTKKHTTNAAGKTKIKKQRIFTHNEILWNKAFIQKIYKKAPETRHATRRDGTVETTELRFEAYKTALSNSSFFYALGVLGSGSTREHTAAETTALANNPPNANTPVRSGLMY